MTSELGELSSLEALAEGTAHPAGEDFFPLLARSLARALQARAVAITEVLASQEIRTIGSWPVQQQQADSEHKEDGYIDLPLEDEKGAVLGHLHVQHDAPTPLKRDQRLILDVFAGRAAAELRRLRVERGLGEAEERFRDLFDEAPIAYVHEALDSRFIRANRTAQRILGICPEEVAGTFGVSLVPDTPDARRRVREALASVGRGADTSGVVLELKRKDDGRPIFIQWWSRPDPGGQYTRTMFIDITDRMLMEREKARLQAQNVYLQEEIKSTCNFDEIVGTSAALKEVLENVRRVAPTDSTVLICGETGTGKELIARAIHSASRRADKPFIKLNCAALPAGLVESELFGHERGAFSGAIQRRTGRFELAHHGTIFLDEIGEMPLDVQAKLLRVLQEQEFERVGSSHTTKIDVRVIAATNRDLARAMREACFRQDLYYRLSIFPITLPPLRDRADDIALLAKFFAQRCGPRVGHRVESIDAETMHRLIAYPWPGNIRELENLIERALILSGSNVLHVGPEILGPAAPGARAGPDTAILPARVSAPVPVPEVVVASLEAVQREHILRVLRASSWVIEGGRGAAARLGMKPATLRFRMKKFGISRSTDQSQSR